MYRVVFSKQAGKDREKVKRAGLEKRVRALLELISEDPYRMPPPYEKLVGELRGFYSRRINVQHRLVYAVREEEKTVVIARMWTHYE